MLVGAAAAFLLALPVMRLRGVFLAIATLGFGEVVRIVLINLSWTGGAQGLAFPKLVGVPQAWCALTFVAYGFWRLSPSRLGRALAAIREDEVAAEATGIDVARHRLGVFTASGAIAGLYGVLLAHFSRFADPNEFGFAAAVDGLVVAVVGGTALFIGPLLGSGFLTLIPEAQRTLGIEAGWIRPFLAGALMLTVIVFLPGGLAGMVPHRRPRATPKTLVPPDLPPPPALGSPILTLNAVGKDYGGVRAGLFDRLSAVDNVLLGAHRVSRPTYLRRLLFLPSAQRDERAALAWAATQLDRVGLGDRTHVPAGDLSLAERRRLEIARALAAHPALLVLDEPAAGLDDVDTASLAELIRALPTDAVTVLLIEHNVRMVLETCTRIVVIDSGEVLATGDPTTIVRDPRVIETYLGAADRGDVKTDE